MFQWMTDDLTMRRIHWRLPYCPQRLKRWVTEKMEYCHLAMFTLCYNQFTSCNTVMDTALEPLFWLVDHFTKYMGPVSFNIRICQIKECHYVYM